MFPLKLPFDERFFFGVYIKLMNSMNHLNCKTLQLSDCIWLPRRTFSGITVSFASVNLLLNRDNINVKTFKFCHLHLLLVIP